jgi:1-acyl-sn-glycerol-3-phosphate acyltransferase
MALPRESCYMARDTLFHNRLFGRLIASLNAFPVKRGTADLAAVKESLRRLKAGMSLVLFPEGTRSDDGRIKPLLPGLGAIARKARVPVVPTLVDGASRCWPRECRFPRPGNVIIQYGEPIPPEALAGRSADEITDLLRERLIVMQQALHSRLPERRLQ